MEKFMSDGPSEKFEQINIPCKDCLVQAMCDDKKAIENITKGYDLFDFMLALRKWDESKKVYRKGLIEAWANLGWKIFENIRTDSFRDLPPEVSPVYLDALMELAGVIQWIINSTSWRKGQKFDFDIVQIEHKIDMAKRWVRHASRNVSEK